ncbi:hypothetical protein PS1_007098 [Malus domestica]
MIFKIDGFFFQLHSSLLVSSDRCGSFLSSSARTPSAELTANVASEFEWRFWHIVFFILVFVGKNKDKGKDKENA